MARARRSGWRVLVTATLLVAGAGCGGKFELPTEKRVDFIPSDKSYQMLQTWNEVEMGGLRSINDILLTQGSGAQLFMLFNDGTTGTAPRGSVHAYPLTRPDKIVGIDFPTLFNPVALTSGFNRVYVLDQGDTCLARQDPGTGQCGVNATWNNQITHLEYFWRVREYGLLGGDTMSTFTDTTMAFVNGVAGDDQGRVYVSGIAMVNVPDPNDARFITRTFLSRIYRYLRGPRYPGVVPPDNRMPGANWHRDTTWVIEEGSGIGTLVDPRGMQWINALGPGLYSTDVGNGRAQKLDDANSNSGFWAIDGAQSGQTFNVPLDVSVDASGFVYVTDNGHQRVLRFDPDQNYIQRVDVENNENGLPLLNPVAAAANDSLVYIADRGRNEVIRYQRRK